MPQGVNFKKYYKKLKVHLVTLRVYLVTLKIYLLTLKVYLVTLFKVYSEVLKESFLN